MTSKYRIVAAGVIAAVALSTAGPQVFADTAGPAPERNLKAELDNLHRVRPAAAHKTLPLISVEAAAAAQTARAAILADYLTALHKARVAAFLEALAAAETVRAAARPAATSGRSGRSGARGGDFFDCIRHHESRGNYGAVNHSSGAAGAYQFLPGTWDRTAAHAGRPDLVGVNPVYASPADQDALARHLHGWQGGRPWTGSGC
jgi:muramidase (phage lysozyme)